MPATLEDILKEMRVMSDEIKASQTEIKTSQDRLVSDTINIKSTLDGIQSTLPEMKNQLTVHSEQINSFERDKRRRNLIFFGLRDDSKEERSDVEKKICEMIEKLLESKFTLQELDFCKRLGKFQSDKNRPIIAGFTTERKKYEILRNCHKLKGSVISIREDLPENVRQKRKELIVEMKKQKAQGKEAFIAYDRLVIRDPSQTERVKQKRPNSVSPEIPNKKKNNQTAGTVFSDTDDMMEITPSQGNARQSTHQPLINNFFHSKDSNQAHT